MFIAPDVLEVCFHKDDDGEEGKVRIECVFCFVLARQGASPELVDAFSATLPARKSINYDPDQAKKIPFVARA
jgi:hypothetical protein